jgi:protein TonB
MTNIEVIEGYGKENYGSYALKKAYQKFASRGLIIGVAIHLAAITTYYVTTVVLKDHEPPTVKFMDINELQNAPPLQDVTPPPQVKIETPQEIKVATGVPVVVPDEEAKADLTIQTQEEIKTDISANSNIGNTEGEVKVDISGAIQGLQSDEPGMNDFVAVEQQPVIINKVLPIYPDLAKKAGLEGKVIVKGLIDEKGDIKKVVVLSGDEMFKDAAVQALYQTKFKPAINGNRAVKVWITYPFIFRLK